MNVKNLRALARALEDSAKQHKGLFGKLGFNMAPWLSGRLQDGWTDFYDHTSGRCKTVGCIAGWAWSIGTGKYTVRAARDVDIEEFATDWLGLDRRVAMRLFAPDRSLNTITPLQAAMAVRNVISGARTEATIWRYVPKTVIWQD